MTREEAIALAETKWWEHTTPEQAALFQLNERRMVMPFAKFHEAVEKLLGRPVWTHEFASTFNPGGLMDEVKGKSPAPTMQQILDLIPAEKRIVVQVG